MPPTSPLNFISEIATIITPFLIIILTGIGWRLKNNLERKQSQQDKLHDDRLEIYNQILEPFIILFTSEVAWKANSKNKGKDKQTAALGIMQSLDYRRTAFRLSLVADDGVVHAYNELMQYFYNMDDQSTTNNNDHHRRTMLLLGAFLLEIRKSSGNRDTTLDEWKMLESFITDIRSFKSV